jgi:hypothetical protein
MRTKCLTIILSLVVAVLVISETANVFGAPVVDQLGLSWFQVHISDRWVYQNESKSGQSQPSDVSRWISEVTVTNIINIPQGEVVLRQVRYQGAYKGSGYVADYGDGNYLVRGNCIYFLDAAWDSGALKPDYIKALDNGAVSPDLCFPMEPGKKWGTPDRPWHVEGADNSGSLFSPMVPSDAIHIVSDHFGSGGHMDLWFERGVGIVAERYVHNGTLDEYSRILQRFVPANN